MESFRAFSGTVPACPPACDTGRAAQLVAGRLAATPAMVTVLVRAWTGEHVTVITRDRAVRPARRDWARRLRVDPGEEVFWRDGWMVTAGPVLVARVQVAAVPDRLPADIRGGLGGHVPFGALIAAYCPHREARTARATGGDPAVRSAAAVHLGAGPDPCALAWEQFTAEFCSYLAGLAVPA